MTGGLDAATRRRLAVPAVLFALYVLHLVFRRTDPFLTRWIDGCFAFFLALVLAFVILRGSPSASREDEPDDTAAPQEPGAPPSGGDKPPAHGNGAGGGGQPPPGGERYPPRGDSGSL